MDLLSMWACIQDQDTAGHWKQVAGWRKVCELAQAHLGRLKEYRRGLAQAWPPATNAAARAYVAELDDLIDKVQRTHDAAAANYDALAAATRAISSARTELKPLYDEYVDKLQQKRTYEATLADPKAAMGSRVPDKPVTDNDLERINARARNLMYGLSGELQQAQVMLRQPPRSGRPGTDPADPDTYGSGSPAPVIPPIIPVPLAGNKTPPTSQRPATIRPVATPIAPATGPVIGAGPILGGIGNNFTPSVGSKTPATSSPTHSPIGTPAAIPPMPFPTSQGGGTGTKSNSFGRPNQPPAIGSNASPHTTSPIPARPLPLGGVIGSLPGVFNGQPGAIPPRRVNPVGGVIPGGGAGTAPSGAAGSRPRIVRSPHLDSPPGPLLKRPGETGENASDWDPDHPWEAKRGVNPVVRAPENDNPIDPGPAIGFDR
jgi:hypothetical protein